MTDEHLEAAAEALRDEGDWGHMSSLEAVGVVVAAYLSSLCAELPEEAVEAGAEAVRNLLGGEWRKFNGGSGVSELVLKAALAALMEQSGASRKRAA